MKLLNSVTCQALLPNIGPRLPTKGHRVEISLKSVKAHTYATLRPLVCACLKFSSSQTTQFTHIVPVFAVQFITIHVVCVPWVPFLDG